MRHHLPILAFTLLAVGLCQQPAASQQPDQRRSGDAGAEPTDAATPRPNILWITAEDMSPTMGCYGDRYATTPNLDRLAAESVRYTRVFASAPVCSPARSCLITGCYAPSLGTQAMRSAFPIPASMTGFPALLRDRGYYTSNNSKTDYNTSNWQQIVAASWDDSSDTAHWRNRIRPDQPFFSVMNLMTSHQSRSMAWPYERFVTEVQSRLAADAIHDPAQTPLPPYYPDTPIIRRTLARYYDCVTAMDQEVGMILRQLDEDGLADDTIVFFFSDHGSGLPRHKRALLDSGMHVPLLIRVPDKYRHLASADPGATDDALLSFVDLPATVLTLAGASIPDYLQGRAVLGPDRPAKRQYVYGHRDRVDEAFDVARSVRDARYLYIRNYMPHLSYNQPTAWPDLGEVRHEFYRLANRSQMTDPQWHFAGPSRPVEELYDCLDDPQNLQNLAESPAHASVLMRMRSAHRQQVRAALDWGFIPEAMAWRLLAGKTPWQAARSGAVDLQASYEAAWSVGTADEEALIEQLNSPQPEVRYWGAIGLAARQQVSHPAQRTLQTALGDAWPSVRIAAADALLRHDAGKGAALPVLVAALDDSDLNVVLQAARTVELLGEKARPAIPAMRRLETRVQPLFPAEASATFVFTGPQDLAMFCSFAARAFLARTAVDPGPLPRKEKAR